MGPDGYFSNIPLSGWKAGQLPFQLKGQLGSNQLGGPQPCWQIYNKSNTVATYQLTKTSTTPVVKCVLLNMKTMFKGAAFKLDLSSDGTCIQ